MMIIRTSSSSMMILLILLSTMMIFIQMSDAAINYHCDDNQVLIVQQFGNDTIRMHCQVVNLCGYENLKCIYDENRPQCDDEAEFVSHVHQATPVTTVTHTCCSLRPRPPNYDGNDCFVYELPDGKSIPAAIHTGGGNPEYTVLSHATTEPEDFGDYSGYRLRLFLLKNKSPPTLIVKGIERKSDGYRVTICRPRCGRFRSKGEVYPVSPIPTKKAPYTYIDNGEKAAIIRTEEKAASGDIWRLWNSTGGGDSPVYRQVHQTWETWTTWSSSTKKTEEGSSGDVKRHRGIDKTTSDQARGDTGTIDHRGHHSIGGAGGTGYGGGKLEKDSNSSPNKEDTLGGYDDRYGLGTGTYGKGDSTNSGYGATKSGYKSSEVDSLSYPYGGGGGSTTTGYGSGGLKVTDGGYGSGARKETDGGYDGGYGSGAKVTDGYGIGTTTPAYGHKGLKETDGYGSGGRKETDGGYGSGGRKVTDGYGSGAKVTDGYGTGTTTPAYGNKGLKETDGYGSGGIKGTDGYGSGAKVTDGYGTGTTTPAYGNKGSKGSGSGSASTTTTGYGKRPKSTESNEYGGADIYGNGSISSELFGTPKTTRYGNKSNESSSTSSDETTGYGSTRTTASSGFGNSSKSDEYDKKNKGDRDRKKETKPHDSNASYEKVISSIKGGSKAGKNNTKHTSSHDASESSSYELKTATKATITNTTSRSGATTTKYSSLRRTKTTKKPSRIGRRGGGGASAQASNTFVADGGSSGSGGGGGGGGGASCFSGDSIVHTTNGVKLMRDLLIGDQVLVPAGAGVMKYERVEMFYHRNPDVVTKFVSLTTSSGRTLALTELHLLPFGQCNEMRESLDMEQVEDWMRKARFAYKAQVGHCVFIVDENSGAVRAETIVKIGRRVERGIYSPMTVDGSIVANGVLASCFSQVESHSMQKIVYDLLIDVHSWTGQLANLAQNLFVPDVPILVDLVHQLSRNVLPFAKY